MCKSKMSTLAIQPKNSNSRISRTNKSSSAASTTSRRTSSSVTDPCSSSINLTSINYTTGSTYKDDSLSSLSSLTSLSSLKDSLPDNPHIYDFSEIRSATNNFHANRFSSSSSSSSSSAAWRCSIRGKDVVIFQRKFRRPIQIPELRQRLSSICKSHHGSLVKLLGASISGNYVYLVYDYVHGANLANCLRNPKNPNFTVLSNWISRMQIATDLAHGLDYVHHFTGLDLCLIHNHIKSSSIIVTEPSLNAKMCHFGTAVLCGEVVEDRRGSSELRRSDSGAMKFGGTRGYMSPEFQSTGVATQKSDVFAFGVVVLELLSGEEALKYGFDDESGGYKRISVIETAREAVEGGGGGGLRGWVDRRLRDSYPVEVAEKMTRLGLECVDVDPDKRPDMGKVAGRISKLYLESRTWAESMGVPTDFSVSLAPR